MRARQSAPDLRAVVIRDFDEIADRPADTLEIMREVAGIGGKKG